MCAGPARPTYPRQLFDYIFQQHERTPGARWDTALDLGCGTGLSLPLPFYQRTLVELNAQGRRRWS